MDEDVQEAGPILDGRAPGAFRRHEAAFTASGRPLTLELINTSVSGSRVIFDELCVTQDLWRDFPPEYPIGNVLTHHDHTPGARYQTKPSIFDSFEPVWTEINSLGIRGPEPRASAPHRVLLVGDSFVEARAVRFDDTFAQRLNKSFHKRIEFIAHGVSSWAPTPEFSWIHHRGLKLQPDEIVLFLCWNDFFTWSTYAASDEAYRGQVIWQDAVPIGYVAAPERHRREMADKGTPLIAPWLAQSRLLALLMQGWRVGARALTPPLTQFESMQLFAMDASVWPNPLRRAVDGTIDVVVRLSRYLKERNIGLVVTLVPNGLAWPDELVQRKRYFPDWKDLSRKLGKQVESFSLTQQGLSSHVARELRANGIEWLDLESSFYEAKKIDSRPLYYSFDGHWTAKGHEVVCNALMRLFSNSDILRLRNIGSKQR